MGTIEARVRGLLCRAARGALAELAWFAVISFLVGVAAVFAAIAAYQALLLVWPPWAAAAALAGGALVFAGLSAVLRKCRRRVPVKADTAATGMAEDIVGDLSELTDAAVQATLVQYRKDPAGTLIGAVAVGAIIGLLDPRPPRR